MTTFLAIAENSRLEFKSLSCPAKGKLSRVDGKYVMSEILLQPVLVIVDEQDREKAEKILFKAEKACLITNSITAKVFLEPKIELAESLIY